MKAISRLRDFLKVASPWIEAALVGLAAAPLLFPTLSSQATLAALGLLAVWWIVQLWNASHTLPLTPFNGALLLWSVCVGVGTLVTAYPDLTLSKATGLLLGLALWRALTLWIKDERRLTWALLGLLLLGAGFAGIGVVSVRWSTKIPVLSAVIARLPQQVLTLPGGPESGVNANQLAGLLAFYTPLLLALTVGRLWGAKKASLWLGRVFSFGGLLLSGGFLLLTQSRSGWMGAATGGVALLLLWGLAAGRRWRRLALAGLGVLLVAGGVLVFNLPALNLTALWQTPGGVETDVGQLSLSGRVEIWSRALYAIQDFPFTGCGLGTFRQVIWLLYPLFTIAPERDIAHAHNIFFQVALDTGLPGLIAYLALLLITGKVCWDVAQQNARLRSLALGVLAGLVALHVYGLTDALAPGSKPALIFWYALGVLTAMERLSSFEAVKAAD